MNEFKDRLEWMIKDAGLKKKDFAARLSMTPQYISQLCKGTRSMSVQTAMLVEREFGYHAEWLLNGTGEPKDPVDELTANRKELLKRLASHSDEELEAILAFLEKIQTPGDTTTVEEAYEMGKEARRRITEGKK